MSCLRHNFYQQEDHPFGSDKIPPQTDKHKVALKDAMSAFIADPLTQHVKSLEVRLCLLLAEKNISLSTGEKILNVFKKEIPGHQLLSRASLGKTKASNL